MAWAALTHRMHKEWQQEGLQKQKLLVLWSGGEDSTALVALARELQKPLGFSFSVGHCHHGSGPLAAWRDAALEFCKKRAQEWDLPFLSERSDSVLSSEADLRRFRCQTALHWKEQGGFDRILTAHHAQDLLETRLFRLLRGTGPQGLRAIQAWRAPWWRPWLKIEKSAIRDFLKWQGIEALQDPSNFDLRYKRNWIRHHLLPEMEKGVPGAIRNLAQSLERCLGGEQDLSVHHEVGLSRTWLLSLHVEQQKGALAQYLNNLGVSHYQQSQIEEVLKRLDNPKRMHSFKTAGCEWTFNAGQVVATPQASQA